MLSIDAAETSLHPIPWNKGRLIGQKRRCIPDLPASAWSDGFCRFRSLAFTCAGVSTNTVTSSGKAGTTICKPQNASAVIADSSASDGAGLPLIIAAVAEFVEHAAHHQKHRLGRRSSALQPRAEHEAADLDRAHRRHAVLIDRDADRLALRIVADRVIEPVGIAQAASSQARYSGGPVPFSRQLFYNVEEFRLGHRQPWSKQGRRAGGGVLGETPNLAARLQALARPGTLVVADSTRRQIGTLFEIEDLGPQPLAGFAEPQPAWRVVGESGVVSRFEALRSGITPLVGRHSGHCRGSTDIFANRRNFCGHPSKKEVELQISGFCRHFFYNVNEFTAVDPARASP